MKAVTFYGEAFEVRANRGSLPPPGNENSTTAGENCSEDSTASSSEASEPPTVGFWHHGQWVNRPRTPEEQRRHVGGRGMRRSLKREARMAVYFRGEWKPKWLEDYIKQKQARSSGLEPAIVALDAQASSDPAVASSQGAETMVQNPMDNPWADLGWWTQSDWDHWWSWNGVNSSEKASTTPTSSQITVPWSLWGATLSWTSSTSSTTTSVAAPPNHGLGPGVFPAHPPLEQRMSLTNGEIASLQEAAVPERTVGSRRDAGSSPA